MTNKAIKFYKTLDRENSGFVLYFDENNKFTSDSFYWELIDSSYLYVSNYKKVGKNLLGSIYTFSKDDRVEKGYIKPWSGTRGKPSRFYKINDCICRSSSLQVAIRDGLAIELLSPTDILHIRNGKA